MKTFVITCTGDRPEALEICNHYLERQAHQNFTWIVVDDGVHHNRPPRADLYLQPPPMEGISLVRNLEMALKYIKPIEEPSLIIIVEDDDWYHGGYIGLMHNVGENLPPGKMLFGESNTRYYNVRWRTFNRCGNDSRASLCATCFTSEFIPHMLEVLKEIDPEKPHIDVAIFNKHPEKASIFPTDLVCGIKGMPGRKGIGQGHTKPIKRLKRDPYMLTLQDWIGEDSERYRRFYHDHEMRDVPIRPDQLGETWALAELERKDKGRAGHCVIFRQPGTKPDPAAFAAGTFVHGYHNDILSLMDAEKCDFPPCDLAVVSGGPTRFQGCNGTIIDHYNAIGTPVIICHPGRLMPETQHLFVNEVHWIPPGPCSRDRLELLGLEYKPRDRGENILIAGQRAQMDNLLIPVIEEIRKVSDRKIVYRPHPNMWQKHQLGEYKLVKGRDYDELSADSWGVNDESRADLEADLDNAWCVLTHSSIVGLTGILRGIPCIAAPRIVCDMAVTPLEEASRVDHLDRPNWNKVHDFLRRFSYSVWFESEIRSGKAFDYLKQFIKKEQL